MSRTRNERVEDLFFEKLTGDPSEEGQLRATTADDLKIYIGGLPRLLLHVENHRPVDQLVHGIAETSFDEYVYTGNRVDAIITWTDNGKTVKIREELFAYTGNKVDTITTKHYDGAGALITGETMVETFSFTGAKLDDVDRAVS